MKLPVQHTSTSHVSVFSVFSAFNLRRYSSNYLTPSLCLTCLWMQKLVSCTVKVSLLLQCQFHKIQEFLGHWFRLNSFCILAGTLHCTDNVKDSTELAEMTWLCRLSAPGSCWCNYICRNSNMNFLLLWAFVFPQILAMDPALKFRC